MDDLVSPSSASVIPVKASRGEYLRGFGLLLLIAIVGLFIVKWEPYYQKAFIAAAHHTLGASMISGKTAAPPTPSLGAAWNYAKAYYLSIWQALLLGLLLAATVETLVPRDWIARVMGSSSARSSALGGLLAIPGMMCTCCTAPVIVGMRKSGVSEGAATAFFLGNPTLNPAVLVFLIFTLGWQWAALRLALGLALVIGGAALAMRLTRGQRTDVVAPPDLLAPTATPGGHWALRWLKSFGRLALTLIPEYVIIVLLLGAARAWLFPAGFILHGPALLVMLGLAIAGTLFVIPTAGEIPIIQTLMAFGLGAGGAGVLLLTLAPLSLPSLAMVWRVFPKRVIFALVALTALMGIVAGIVAIGLGL